MGAGCYKAKNLTISKEDVLRAINEQYVNDTIQTDANRNQNSVERPPGNLTQESGNKSNKSLKINKVMHLAPTENSAASTGLTT